jgi:DNA-binding NarL/FixJ family response regulator
MAQGLSTEQIAPRLFVGQVTVRTHIAHVLKKLKVSDRDEAIRLLR